MKTKIEKLESLANFEGLPLYFKQLNTSTKKEYKVKLFKIPIPVDKYTTNSFYKSELGFYKKITKTWK